MNITGILVGIVVSIAAWLLIVHIIRPSLRFSDGIAMQTYETQTGTNHVVYRVGIENHHRFLPFLHDRRYITELTVRAYLYAGQMDDTDPYNAQIEIPLHVQDLPRLATHRMLRLECSREDLLVRLPSDLQAVVRSGDEGYLEAILRALPNPSTRRGQPNVPFIRIFVAGGDSFTGVRRVFVSHPYTSDAIARGAIDTNSLKLVRFTLG